MQFPGATIGIEVASADASFRHYFRVTVANQTFILMDAPPVHENCQPFVDIAQLFGEAGVHVPKVLAQDMAQGFLLLTDLGGTTYLAALNEESADARLLQNNLAQGKVYVHRDYHSRNLMVTQPNPGILDFQDAVYGPVTYDLVSLFKDAYIGWEEDKVLDWVIRYWDKAKKAGLPVAPDFADFYQDFEWMGVQRHIKVLGIFARLYHRDGKEGYLKDMPLVSDYLRKTCKRYNALAPLINLLDELEGAPEAGTGYTF